MGDYLLKHSQEFSEKYPGKYIAIIKDELVAVGKSNIEVFKKAKEQHPGGEVSISYIPTDKEMVTLL
ncbi:hypothetical protein KKH56_04945 [bacterium]|nr:hypothetical protein [bacterium]